MQLAEDRTQQLNFVNTVTNYRVLLKVGNFLPVSATIQFFNTRRTIQSQQKIK
jgi:hypothetical protein